MRILMTIVLAWLIPVSYANQLHVDAPLPPLSIEEKGELVLKGDQVGFRDWHSDAAQGFPHVIQYMAARMSSSKINEPFTDALDAADLPSDRYRVTTIINLSDALWGTGGFVIRELEKNKRKHPHAVMVADDEGLGRTNWGLQRESSAIILLDSTGKIRFFKDGALTGDEIEQVLQMLRDAVGAADSSP